MNSVIRNAFGTVGKRRNKDSVVMVFSHSRDALDGITIPNRPNIAPGEIAPAAIKRVLDLLFVVVAGVPAALIVSLASLAILITSGCPVFFVQNRIGLNGRTFRMIKLRTMTQRSRGGAPHTSKVDSRVTRLGYLLRQYHIDELPQLMNVLRGDMSLIGPRPEQPHMVVFYRSRLPNYDHRHLLRPGITGLAQIKYGYAANLEETRVKLLYDNFYVQNASIGLDLAVLMWTILTVVLRKGAR
jgi:lipopolysaccharide/colanic/teichoic acid biosynthesis glycosyltransferase